MSGLRLLGFTVHIFELFILLDVVKCFKTYFFNPIIIL